MKRELIARASVPMAQPEAPAAGLERPPSGATDEHLAIINAMPQVLRPVGADDVYVRGIMAANDQPWNRGWQFEPAAIARLAELAPGVPILFNHDEGDWGAGRMALPAGRLFAGEEVLEGGVRWTRVQAWYPATEANTELIQMQDAGGVAEVSVGAGYEMLECTICETDLFECAHVPLQTYDGKLCLGIVRGIKYWRELSTVWKGDVKGTRFYMAASDAEAIDTDVALRECKGQGIGHLLSKEEPSSLGHLFARG